MSDFTEKVRQLVDALDAAAEQEQPIPEWLGAALLPGVDRPLAFPRVALTPAEEQLLRDVKDALFRERNP